MQARTRGFTLAETLVVLVIVGILLAVLPPLLTKGVPSLRLKNAARDVSSGLRLARGEALRRGVPAVFEIDTGARVLRVPTARKQRSLPDDVTIEVTTAADAIVDDTTAAFRFYPDGSASGGNILLSIGEQGFRVTVDWLTGRIHVADEKI
jgi:general secretion pathway protein H